MGYLTEQQLNNIIDVPIALPSTDIVMGDWLVIATVNIPAPMQASYTFCSMNLVSSTVSIASLDSTNYIFSSLGLAYVAVCQNYTNGIPGQAGALDALSATNFGIFTRNLSSTIILPNPGTYSFVVANNMQPSTAATPAISPATSIDFQLSVTGSVRLQLSDL